MYCFENILLDIIYTFHHAFTLYQSFGLGNKLCLVLSCLARNVMLKFKKKIAQTNFLSFYTPQKIQVDLWRPF